MEQKLLPASKKINTESLLGNKKGKSSGGIMVSKMKLIQINSRTVKIEKLLGRENKRLKSQIKKVRVSSEKETRAKKETRLELFENVEFICFRIVNIFPRSVEFKISKLWIQKFLISVSLPFKMPIV